MQETPDVIPRPLAPRRGFKIRAPETTALKFDAPVVAAETTQATVLFADMRGYTALSERLPPARVVALLDEFFCVLAGAAAEYGGQIYYTAGDGMMAGFGVRDSSQYGGAREALAAGRAMLLRFTAVAARWRRDLSVVAGIGIGLHRGEVALGFLGPPGKKSMTLVGDTVNVAARLCSRARTGEVLFSATVASALGAEGAAPGPRVRPTPFLQLPQYELRGRNGLLDIWCLPAQERLAL